MNEYQCAVLTVVWYTSTMHGTGTVVMHSFLSCAQQTQGRDSFDKQYQNR